MASQPSSEDIRLLVKVSRLHYEDDLTQDAITTRLGLSRSKVSRLLAQARETGIVQITVVAPVQMYVDMEGRLEEPRFRRAIVWLVGSRCAGTLLAQVLLLPAASLIVFVAQKL